MLLYDIKVIVEMWAFIEFFSYDLLGRDSQMYHFTEKILHYILLTLVDFWKENHIKAVTITPLNVFKFPFPITLKSRMMPLVNKNVSKEVLNVKIDKVKHTLDKHEGAAVDDDDVDVFAFEDDVFDDYTILLQLDDHSNIPIWNKLRTIGTYSVQNVNLIMDLALDS